jgi:hypothetical protein
LIVNITVSLLGKKSIRLFQPKKLNREKGGGDAWIELSC